MNKPAAWRLKTTAGYFLFSDLVEARSCCLDNERPEPLYTAAEIERKDAAIAELVAALKEARSYIIELCGSLHIPLPETSMERFNSAIAKYDIPRAES